MSQERVMTVRKTFACIVCLCFFTVVTVTTDLLRGGKRPALMETFSMDPLEKAKLEASSSVMGMSKNDSDSIGVDSSPGLSSLPAVQSSPVQSSILSSSSRLESLSIHARAYPKWNKTLPCFPPEKDWLNFKIGKTPAQQGFLFVKSGKTGSSTGAGINLRLSTNVGKRRNLEKGVCKNRFHHMRGSSYAKRDRSKSFMWSLVRDPTTRTMSQFFHFLVSRRGVQPTDVNVLKFLNSQEVKDRQVRYLSMRNPHHRAQGLHANATRPAGHFHKRLALHSKRSLVQTVPPANTKADLVNSILSDYDFIGVTERMDETAVALQMLLGLSTQDVMFLKSLKSNGNYDDGMFQGKCFLIQKSVVSPAVREYLNGEKWKQAIYWDKVLHEAANKSLDMTIEKLGRAQFEKNLDLFRRTQAELSAACSGKVVFPCSATGERIPENRTDCLFGDNGCGFDCMDNFFRDWDETS